MADAYGLVTGSFPPWKASLQPGPGLNPQIAAGRAAYRALSKLYTHTAQIDAFMIAYTKFLNLVGATIPGPVLAASANFGDAIADQVYASRADDKAALLAFDTDADTSTSKPYSLAKLYGIHDHPAPLQYGPGLGLVPPAVITTAELMVVRSPAPPGLTSGRYDHDHKEVASKGALHSTTRTADEEEVGIFWGYDGAYRLGTPPRLYNQVTHQVCMADGLSEAQNMRLLAAVNLAMFDAGIAAWDAKYVYNIWRPDAGIARDPLGRGTPNWQPLGAPDSNLKKLAKTPNFPAYPSGHATFGAAAFTVIKTLRKGWGLGGSDGDSLVTGIGFRSDEYNGTTTDSRTNSPRPFRTRAYATLSDMIRENLESRVWLGVHWRFDGDEGAATGAQIGDIVAKRVYA